jgi:hypothetical protein
LYASDTVELLVNSKRKSKGCREPTIVFYPDRLARGEDCKGFRGCGVNLNIFVFDANELGGCAGLVNNGESVRWKLG